ncbi:MAG: hypothetical protein ACRYFS_25245 [Janthinobacterium lividum]
MIPKTVNFAAQSTTPAALGRTLPIREAALRLQKEGRSQRLPLRSLSQD